MKLAASSGKPPFILNNFNYYHPFGGRLVAFDGPFPALIVKTALAIGKNKKMRVNLALRIRENHFRGILRNSDCYHSFGARLLTLGSSSLTFGGRYRDRDQLSREISPAAAWEARKNGTLDRVITRCAGAPGRHECSLQTDPNTICRRVEKTSEGEG